MAAKDRKAARIAYNRESAAALREFKKTEDGLRKLEGLKAAQIEKVILARASLSTCWGSEWGNRAALP